MSSACRGDATVICYWFLGRFLGEQMFIERKIYNGAIELWQCRWENPPNGLARKVWIQKVADETDLSAATQNAIVEAPAICWSYGRTLGNIAVQAAALFGQFPAEQGSDAKLPCNFVHAGKFRNGVERWWCRTHQTHWGTRADCESLEQAGVMRCANHEQLMNYVIDPLSLDLGDYTEVGIWCSLPPALSTEPIVRRPPNIHVHVRNSAGGAKGVDDDFAAISILYTDELGIFGNSDITRVNVTPPAAFEFVSALEAGQEMGCVCCQKCGYPHLDLGDFAKKPHRRHFCGNCGRDSTWSKLPMVSTPLKPLFDQFAKGTGDVVPQRTLNLDDYEGCAYRVWASTPAVLWTAERPQEVGIHVHVEDRNSLVIDETFADVSLNGEYLDRKELLEKMFAHTIV